MPLSPDKLAVAAAAQSLTQVLERVFPADGKFWTWHIHQAGEALLAAMMPETNEEKEGKGVGRACGPHFDSSWDRSERLAVMEAWAVLIGRSAGPFWNSFAADDALLRERIISLLLPLAQLACHQPPTPRPPTPTAEYCLLTSYRVCWKGDPIPLRPQLWRLLQYLLSRNNYPIPACDVRRVIWDHDKQPASHHFANTLASLNTALLPVEFPWTWHPDSKSDAVSREG